MRILFLSDNFPPESNAPATRLYEHACYWVAWGHEVTVLTCAPNFPEGVVYPGYRNRCYQVEILDGIRVVRVKTFITPNEGFFLRTLDYASFMVAAVLAGLFERRPDVVIATSPQFFAPLGAWLLAAVRRLPFLFELRDLWPASIVAVEAMRRGVVIRLLERLELFLYRRATAIVVVTQAYKANLSGRGIASYKITVVGNGVDLERYAPRPREVELARAHGLAGKFVVGYVGTHGLAHALDRVLEAAERLRGRPEIAFLFVGSGAARDSLAAAAARRGLSNVIFLPRQRKEDMPKVWSLCDVALVHFKDAPLLAKVVPSKIFEAMGMGLPILLCAPDGEAVALLRDTGAGLVVPAERPERLAEAVATLCDDPDRRRALAQASRAAAPRFSRERQAQEMLEVIGRAIREKAPPVPARGAG